MKKFLFFILINIISINIYAKEDIDFDIVVSLQHRSMDWWYLVPDNATPFVQDLKSCYRRENLNIYLFAKFKEDKDLDIEYELLLKDNKGNISNIIKNTKFKFDKVSKNSILAFPRNATYIFDYSAEYGKYNFILKIKDKNSERKFTKNIELKKWEFPKALKTEKEATSLMFNYAQSVDPQKLLAMFISDKVPLLQTGAPMGLNFLFLSFYKYSFDSQEFLYSKLLQIYPKSSESLKKKILILFAYAKRDFNMAVFNTNEDFEVYKYLSTFSIKDPYKGLDGKYAPAQLDMLWGEFYALGRYKTFLQIIDILKYTEQGAYTENLIRNKEKPKTNEEKANFAIGMTYLSNLKRISLNLDNDLFKKYLYIALESKNLSQAISVQLAILIKTANQKDGTAIRQ